ncbi:MAG: flagellin FliC [Magnetococcus sp. WYHC-3]
MLSLNINPLSLIAQRNLGTATNRLAETYQRLSSGLRITSSSDDPAGQAIVTQFEARIRGMDMSIRNANDAMALLQVADGALTEIENAIFRIRDLAVESATDTVTDDNRATIQTEVDSLLDEIERIASTTEYNGHTLLDEQGGSSSNGTFTFHIGPDATALTNEYAVSINSATAAAGTTNAVMVALRTAYTGGAAAVGTQAGAAAAITLADDALEDATDGIAVMKANIGSAISRLESTVENLESQKENTEAARSQLVDTDIAAETAQLAADQVLQQAAVAVLTQANQQPLLALRLLGVY